MGIIDAEYVLHQGIPSLGGPRFNRVCSSTIILPNLFNVLAKPFPTMIISSKFKQWLCLLVDGCCIDFMHHAHNLKLLIPLPKCNSSADLYA